MIKSKIILMGLMVLGSSTFAACKTKKATTKAKTEETKITKKEQVIIPTDNKDKPKECNNKWGANELDSLNNIKNYYLMGLDRKDGNYFKAYNYWQLVHAAAPCATENLYYYATEIFDSVRARITDDSRKKIILDSLFSTYPEKIKYFGKKADVNLEWAYALQENYPDKTSKIFNLFQESEDKMGAKMDYYATSNYFLTAVELYKKKGISQSDLIDLYLKLSENGETNMGKNIDKEDWKGTQDYMDQLVAQFKLLDCANISSIFGPKMEANPADLKLKLTVIKLFRAGRCSSNPMYISTLKAAHTSNPTLNTSKELARYYSSTGQHQLANPYWAEVVNGTDDVNEKANIYLRLANSGTCANKKMYLNKVLAINPNNGKALINKVILLSKCSGCSGFDAMAANWVYVDMLINVKAKDPSVAGLANKYIASYKKGYPSKKAWFQKNLKPGQSYTVACLGRSTKVR